jgi:hypothetical protein
MTMPFKSQAQQKYMHAAAERGEIPNSVVSEFDAATTKRQFEHLPKRVKKAQGGIIPEGFVIVSEQPACFEVDGPRGRFKVARKSLSKRMDKDLHDHFAKGGEVQRLAAGDEVAEPKSKYAETLGDVATSLLSAGTAGASPPAVIDPNATPEQRVAQGATRLLGVPLETATASAREAGQALGQSATQIPGALARFAGYEGTENAPVKATPEQLAIAAAPVIAASRALQPASAVSAAAPPKPAYVPDSALRSGGGGGGGMGVVNKEISAGMALSKEGILEEAKAEKAQADATAMAYQDLEARQESIKTDFEMKLAKVQQRGDLLKQEIKDSKIDPRGFWNKKDTAGKISAGIAIMLSGLGQGLAGGQNMAMQVIDKAIDRDIDAQKAELGKKESLMSMYVQEGHDLQSAYQLAKADSLSATSAQLQVIASRFAGEKAQAVALAKSGALDTQAAQLRMDVMARGQEMALKGVQMDAAKLEIGLERAHQRWIEQGAASPEVQADPRWIATGQLQGWVPKAMQGSGIPVSTVSLIPVKNTTTGKTTQELTVSKILAADKESAKKLRDSTRDTYDAMQGFNDLEKEWNKKWKFIPWSDARAGWDSALMAMIGKLRLPLTGPGILNEQEFQRIKDALPKIYNTPGQAEAKLQALRNVVMSAHKGAIAAYAIEDPVERAKILKNTRDEIMTIAGVED